MRAKFDAPNLDMYRRAYTLALLIVLLSINCSAGGIISTSPTDENGLPSTMQLTTTLPQPAQRLAARLERVAEKLSEFEMWLKQQTRQVEEEYKQVGNLKQAISHLEVDAPESALIHEELAQFERHQNQLEDWVQEQREQLADTHQKIQHLRGGVEEYKSLHSRTVANPSKTESEKLSSQEIMESLLKWLEDGITQIERKHALTLLAWLKQKTLLANFSSGSPRAATLPPPSIGLELKPVQDDPVKLAAAKPAQLALQSVTPEPQPSTILEALETSLNEPSAQLSGQEATHSDQAYLDLKRELELLDRELSESRTAAPRRLGREPLAFTNPPEVCTGALQDKITRIEESRENSEVWFQELFECNECCAPLLDEVIEIHTQHVVTQPHTVVLFDFDTYTINSQYHPHIDGLLQDFDRDTDYLLMIGRASPIGHSAYNIALSGKRAGSIKDYVMEKFGLRDAQIRYFYFGHAPPQLTIERASAYGIKTDDLDRIDLTVNTSAEHKINQSVVIIAYKGAKK